MDIWGYFAVILLSSLILITYSLRRENQLPAIILAALLVIFTRAMHVLNPYREFGDSYHYWHAPEAILKNGAPIAPEIANRYPGIEQLLSFPGMHITTVSIIEVAGFEDMALARALIPSFYGVIAFLIFVALAARVVRPDWAVIIGYAIAQIDAVIFYQTEYHAQSFGLIFIALVYLILLRAIDTSGQWRNVALIGPAVAGLAIAHRFSSLLSILLFALVLVGIHVYDGLPRPRVSRQTKRTVTWVALTLGVSILWVHIGVHTFVSEKIGYRGIAILQGSGFGFYTAPPSSGGGGSTVLDHFSLILKGILVLVAAPTILYSLLDDFDDEVQLTLSLLGGLGIAGVLTAALSFHVVTRVILIAFVPLTLIAFYTIHSRAPDRFANPTAVAFAFLIVVLGVMGGTTPSLVDPSSDIRDDGFSGVEPMSGEHEQAGYWLQDYATSDETAVTTVTLHSATTFGHQRQQDTEFIAFANGEKQYVLVDEARRDLPADTVVYSNGRILVGYNATFTGEGS